MSHTCAQPISWDALADYWAHDLSDADSDRIDEQIFACAGCAKAAARIAQIAHALKGGIPPVISAQQLDQLRVRGLRIDSNEFLPNVRKEVVFPSTLDILVHRLCGLELRDAERVELAVKVESTGDVIFQEMFAPFDRDRGEVLVACQKHFTMYPSDIHVEVRVHRQGEPATVSSFLIPHVFEQ